MCNILNILSKKKKNFWQFWTQFSILDWIIYILAILNKGVYSKMKTGAQPFWTQHFFFFWKYHTLAWKWVSSTALFALDIKSPNLEIDLLTTLICSREIWDSLKVWYTDLTC